MIGSQHLTGTSRDQELTYPGQAHFAVAGETRKCGDCSFWAPEGSKRTTAICAKARATSSSGAPKKIPGFATACKYFEARGAA